MVTVTSLVDVLSGNTVTDGLEQADGGRALLITLMIICPGSVTVTLTVPKGLLLVKED